MTLTWEWIPTALESFIEQSLRDPFASAVEKGFHGFGVGCRFGIEHSQRDLCQKMNYAIIIRYQASGSSDSV